MPIVYDDAQPAAAAPRTIHYDDDVIKDVKGRAKDERPKKKADGPDWSKFPGFGLPELAANMGSGMLAKPVSDIAGLAATGKEMVSPGGGDPQAFQRSVREGMTYQPRTDAGKAAEHFNPMQIIAKMISQAGRGAGRMFGSEDKESLWKNALGRGVEETVNQLPNLVGAGSGRAGAAMTGEARSLMSSALKPSAKAQSQKLPVTGKSKSDSAIDTLLDEGVNVSRGGAEKLRDRITGINDKISKIIDGSPAVIDKKATAAYLDDAVKKFEKQVTPLDDLAAIQKAWDEFLAVHPDKIPVKQAQELKQGTTRALGDKSYGELKGAATEAQKTLARGLKEEIAKAVPQVRKLNAEESQLLNALSLVEKRALMEANKNPMGLALLTTNPVKWAAFMADRSGPFKSIVARMLNTAGEAAPVALPPLGMAVSSQTGQLPPPPQQ